MSQPSISIVTPSFNQAAFIEDAITSALTQEYADFEHLIIDGGSTDGTLDIVARYPHLRVVVEPDDGQADAVNKGLRLATGDVIGWLNSDDRYVPGAFKAVVHYLGRSGTDIVYGDFNFIDEQGRVTQRRRELDFDLFMLKYLHVLTIPSVATFMRRRIIDAGEYLDISYHYAMDYEYYLRLATKGYRFEHTPTFLADYRWHDDSKSSRYARLQEHEREKALLEHVPLMRRLGPTRVPVRFLLELAARAKRYALKGAKGFYRDQWVEFS